MRFSKPAFLRIVFGLLALASASLAAHSQAFGASESALWSFGNGTDGLLPYAGPISDSVGNLYGKTEGGGI